MKKSEHYRAKLEAFNDSPNYQIDIDHAYFAMMKYLKPGAETLFDIGCGTGYFCTKVEERNPAIKCHGIDLLVEQFISERCKHSTFNDLMMQIWSGKHRESFDVVTMLHVANHLQHSLRTVMETAIKMLKPSGILVVITNGSIQKATKEAMARAGLIEHPFGDSTMIHNYSALELDTEAVAAGFTKMMSEDYGDPTMDIQFDGRYIAAKTRYLAVYQKPPLTH